METAFCYNNLHNLSQYVTPMFCSFYVGVLAFLLFTERLQIIVDGPTTLNYYWVPFLVRNGGFVTKSTKGLATEMCSLDFERLGGAS